MCPEKKHPRRSKERDSTWNLGFRGIGISTALKSHADGGMRMLFGCILSAHALDVNALFVT